MTEQKLLASFFSKLSQTLLIVGSLLFAAAGSAQAEEITAIDFNGDLIGKVIPDGNVVGLDNKLIGNVTADSLIVNFDGELIGGVVPQGIAIGNDTKMLGKVNNDGSVRLPSGKIVGKVLPNGLVIDDYYNLIGSVLFPGLVYSNDGKTIGRLTGDGQYSNLRGQKIGFFSPSGDAYRQVGSDYVLDGRLISSKMVVSLDGEFIGSVTPGGSVSNFEGAVIGSVHANGFVYNQNNTVIGSIVRSGYALDNRGKYLGFVTYNGEVIHKEKLVGRLRADKKIIDAKNHVIGFMVDFSASATDGKGKYLGRAMPNGKLASGKDIIGQVGPRGIVMDKDGKIGGQLIATGPVFDYRGSLKGISLSNGALISLNGSPIGYVKGAQGYDNSGQVVGAVMDTAVIIDSQNQSLGVSNIGSAFNNRGAEGVVSPYGYVFDGNGTLLGMTQKPSELYSVNGAVVAKINLNGKAVNNSGSDLGKLTAAGISLDERNRVLGKNLNVGFAVDSKGQSLGNLSEDNFVLNNNGEIIAKILPDYSVIPTSSDNSPELMPQNGTAFAEAPVVSVEGDLLGHADLNGVVYDSKHTNIGKVTDNGWAVDNNNILIGRLINYTPVADSRCASIGVVTPDAQVRNFREVNLGRVLANGQLVGANGLIAGQIVDLQPVIDNTGNVIGVVSVDGKVSNYANENLGCIDKKGQLKNASGAVIGAVADYYPVMNFKDKIIGRSVLDGRVVDNDNQFIGYSQPDDNVNSQTGSPLGSLFKYQVAFDNGNQYLGRVNNKAEVISPRNEVVGQVSFDGYVWNKDQKVGYALYDFYVYNNDFFAIGYIAKNGEVLDFNNRRLGQIKRGFLVDKEDKVIGRGNRSYELRDTQNVVRGTLKINNEVYNADNKLLGSIDKAGQLRNEKGEIIAAANPLQYYSSISRQIVVDKSGKVIGYLNENGELVDESGKVIGYKNKNGEIVSLGNNVVGTAAEDGKVYDKNNNLIGYVRPDGSVVDLNGNVIGYKNDKNEVIGMGSQILGKVPEREKAYDANGNFVGYVRPDGTVEDEDGKVIGRLNNSGNVIDASGNILGGIGASWYEKVKPLATDKQPAKPGEEIKVGAIDESKGTSSSGKNNEYRRSLNIALTPDGEYLGDILEDGRVVDKKGNVLGRRMPDGLVIDDNGSLIGIEEVKKTDTNDMFVPAGSFGQGAAYGIGTGPGSNLGPGGGFGPGERYDPQRQYALGVAMSERRRNIAVGKISSGYSAESFDGMQRDWEAQGIGKVISSWRVDMSEMILADKPIPAVIARSIDSNNPTPVTAFVERNVYAEQGRNILIPAGSRVIGTLGGLTASTERTSTSAKVQISWSRLIRPDGSIFVFNGLTGDAQGRGGALGYLDQQLFKRYSLPLMVTALSSLTSYYMADDEDTTGETETSRQQAANDARQNFLSQMDAVFNEILNDKASIRPMTYVPAGTRIIIYPQIDLWLRTADREQYEKSRTDSMNDDLPLQIDGQAIGDNTVGKPGARGVKPSSSQVQYQNTPTGVQEEEDIPLMADEPTTTKKSKVYTPPSYYRPPVSPVTTAKPVTPPAYSGKPAAGSGSSSSSSSGSSDDEPKDNVPQLF